MYVFFLDIDGTICAGQQVSCAVTDAIVRARKAGHKVFINTARAFVGMPAQVYDLPVDGFVNSFGLEVAVGGKFIHRKFIPKERVLEIAQYAFDNQVKMLFEGETRIFIHCEKEGALNPRDMSEFKQMLGDAGICKFILLGARKDEDKARFSQEFNFFAGEGIAKGYNKARGIEIVQAHYAVPREDVVAIGDSDPDMDMVRYAGIGISMGNGTEHLKDCAEYITLSVLEDGVAYAIDRLLMHDLEALKKP